jgi:hypothetical protein
MNRINKIHFDDTKKYISSIENYVNSKINIKCT